VAVLALAVGTYLVVEGGGRSHVATGLRSVAVRW
jgi:hypothetical protein